jgi:hypothetical protein
MASFAYVGFGVLQAKALAAVHTAVGLSAEHLVGAAQADAPVDEGTLRASITTDGAEMSGMGATAKVYTSGESSEYAIFVHEGTGPHEIRPRHGKALAWPGGGHPVKVVHHPGTSATKFLERPLLANSPFYREAMRRAAASVF